MTQFTQALPGVTSAATLRANLVLVLCALIWGLAFAAQKDGMASIGPYLFVALRFTFATLTIFVALLTQRALWQWGGASMRGLVHAHTQPPRMWPIPREWKAGTFLGFFFTLGVLTQQAGLVYTTAGNSAFITGFYVILVPILGLLHGKKLQTSTVFAAILALIGLYFLCVPADTDLRWEAFNYGDVLTLLCALVWTFHVFYVGIVGHWGGLLRIALIQFFMCMTAAYVVTFCLEFDSLGAIFQSPQSVQTQLPWFALLYTGVLSGGLAFFLQLYGQKRASSSSAAAIILSSEALFGALAGWWFLSEALTSRSIFGGSLMLLAMVWAQYYQTD